jgi:hypothetical protein
MPQQAGLTSGGGRAARVSRALARGGAAAVGGPERRLQGRARAGGGSGPAQTSGGARGRVAQARGRHAVARALAWLGRQLERCGSGSARLTASGAEPRRWADAVPERSEDGSWRRVGERLALVACGARRGSALGERALGAGSWRGRGRCRAERAVQMKLWHCSVVWASTRTARPRVWST